MSLEVWFSWKVVATLAWENLACLTRPVVTSKMVATLKSVYLEFCNSKWSTVGSLGKLFQRWYISRWISIMLVWQFITYDNPFYLMLFWCNKVLCVVVIAYFSFLLTFPSSVDLSSSKDERIFSLGKSSRLRLVRRSSGFLWKDTFCLVSLGAC